MKSEFLKDSIDKFLSYIKDIRGYSDSTIITYRTALYQMGEVSEFVEDGSLWTLNITPFRLKIAKLKKKSIHIKISAVNSFVDYMQEQEGLKINVIANEAIKVPQTLPKPIEESYIEEVLKHSNLQERVIILLLYGLGLRISELSNIKLTDIQYGWITITGKGAKMRQLPLLPILDRTVELYQNQYMPRLYLFEKNREKLNSAQLRYIIEKIFKSRGLKITPHQLRHSFATHLLNQGARVSDISELLGHSSMATTQLYTKLSSSKKEDEYLNAHPLAKR